MIKATCIYKNLFDIPEVSQGVAAYRSLYNLQDYDFGLCFKMNYLVVASAEFEGINKLYVVPAFETSKYEVDQLSFVPAVLFEFDVELIEKHLIKQGNEMLPKIFINIPYWFEKYVDEDKDMLKIVENEIKRVQLEYYTYISNSMHT